VRWPGRLEYFPGAPSWIVDAGHNAIAFQAIAAFASAASPRPTTLLFGVSEIEKGNELLRLLGPLFRRVWFADGFYRSIDAAGLARVPAASFSSPESAIDFAMTMLGSDEMVLACGSVFLAGACRRRLLELGYLPRHSGAHDAA
jgi:dihydrofolate synthase/folylpolyglutamate synthase